MHSEWQEIQSSKRQKWMPWHVTGTYFKNAFSTTPICAASRASILTGLYERTHGYTFQKPRLKQPYTDIIYPKLLKETGYHVGFFGKLGVIIDSANQIF